MANIINLTSLTQEDIINDILNFVATDVNSSNWYPFFREHASGRIFTDILAGVSSLLLTHILNAKRESSIKEATLRTSIIAKAENTGYSYFRGTNTRYTMTFTPNISKTVLLYETVGIISDFSLISLEEKSIQSGVSTTLLCTIGTVLESTLTVDTAEMKPFRFNNADVSQDLRFFKDSGTGPVEVSYSTILSELINDKYVILSNPSGGVDIVYKNFDGTNPYGIGDIFHIVYIALLSDKNFVLEEINFLLGTLADFVITSAQVAPEADDAIRINAPLFSETQRVVQGRLDFLKRFKSLNPEFEDTNQFDPDPAHVFITYVKSDETLLSAAEKTNLVGLLSENRPLGIIPPTIIDPINKTLALAITIKRNASANFIGVITDSITAILNQYRHKLGITVDLDSIERDINDITDSKGISYAKSNDVTITNAISPILDWNEYFVFTFSLSLL